MAGRAGMPAELRTPTDVEIDAARSQIDQLVGGGYAGACGAFSAVALGQGRARDPRPTYR
ncbi:hypothetical protein CC117_30090 [Parafrankia colletiae]|uniref:Uncharacterized protein n=1 Tax=Parafrankia colletiae TaxID=573497 RepID=A0A1S1Q3Y0_9ACTN|nr:hypothetical protein [Parafrankia colletiae]OHV28670.1 hypothetical protein CC117_30090 [Parafrankia colletiae]